MTGSEKSAELTALVQIDDRNIALLFCNYLLSQQITANTTAENNTFMVYCDTQKKSLAEAMFEDFIKHPHHPKYQQAAWENAEVTPIKSNGPSALLEFKKQFLKHAGVVTLVVFALCWCVFLLSELGWKRDVFASISFYTHLNFTHLLEQPHRLIGPAFFHYSWMHIVFNTMWWWHLGGGIERTLGKVALINLLLVSAVISNVGQFIVSGPNFGGLSGVVYALFGYVWWYGWLAPEKGLTIPKPIVGFILFFMLLGFANVLPVNMANTAHLLGLLSGCGLAWFKIKQEKRKERRILD